MIPVIPSRIHGILDYVVGLFLIAYPWFTFHVGGYETWVFVGLGVATLIYSALTNYEWGLAKVIPMKAHLIIDLVGALFLIASPWIFNFAWVVWEDHVIVGLFEIVVIALSQTVAYAATAASGGAVPAAGISR